MKNKPVAWRRVIGNVTKHYEYNEVGVGEPLYSLETIRLLKLEIEHQKERELTDEEINDIAQECWVYPKGEQAIFNQHKFAKAILRKAQEK